MCPGSFLEFFSALLHIVLSVRDKRSQLGLGTGREGVGGGVEERGGGVYGVGVGVGEGERERERER